MKRDYASRYSGFRRQRSQAAGRSAGESMLNKAMGVLVTVMMLAGIAVSIWFGWAVRSGLDELHRETMARQELSQLHDKLVAEQQRLRKEERIEAAAAGLGLFPPRRQQVYRP